MIQKIRFAKILWCLFLGGLSYRAAALDSFNIDPKGITVSGISSGAFMAVQMQVAFSKTFSGAGSIAGGVFWCSQGQANRAKSVCMENPDSLHVEENVAKARALEAAGDIDPLANLQTQKVYLYASPKDSVVDPTSTKKLKEFYQSFMPAANIKLENGVESAHGFPTLNVGNPCQVGLIPWLLNCHFDGAGEILQQLYGPLKARGEADPSHLRLFSQKDFGDDGTPLYRNGWIYVPAACAGGALCRLHVALHGCQMSPDFIQDKFAKSAGYNEWAETNDIVVLYPQSNRASGNPYACWDWFGFTGSHFMTKSGAQMKALKAMIDQIQKPAPLLNHKPTDLVTE